MLGVWVESCKIVFLRVLPVHESKSLQSQRLEDVGRHFFRRMYRLATIHSIIRRTSDSRTGSIMPIADCMQYDRLITIMPSSHIFQPLALETLGSIVYKHHRRFIPLRAGPQIDERYRRPSETM